MIEKVKYVDGKEHYVDISVEYGAPESFDEELGEEVATELYIALKNVRDLREYLDEADIEWTEKIYNSPCGSTQYATIFPPYCVICWVDKLDGRPKPLDIFDVGTKDQICNVDNITEFIAFMGKDND